MEIWEFRQKQVLPYKAKIVHARRRAEEFYNEITINRNANVHVSVGGLDSITLLLFLRKYIDSDIKGVSVSSVEDKGNQEVHKQLGIICLKPYKSKTQVLQELGFPVISKEKAAKIQMLQNPTEKKCYCPSCYYDWRLRKARRLQNRYENEIATKVVESLCRYGKRKVWNKL